MNEEMSTYCMPDSMSFFLNWGKKCYGEEVSPQEVGCEDETPEQKEDTDAETRETQIKPQVYLTVLCCF